MTLDAAFVSPYMPRLDNAATRRILFERSSISVQSNRFNSSVINSIEQKLERAVRLTSESDLRSKEKELALSDPGFGDSYAVLKVLLTPRPAASERFVAVKPCYCFDVLHRGFGLESENRTVVEKHVELVRHPVSQRVGVIDAHLED